MGLDDANFVEVRRAERNQQWVYVGLVFIGGGLLLALMALFWLGMVVFLERFYTLKLNGPETRPLRSVVYVQDGGWSRAIPRA